MGYAVPMRLWKKIGLGIIFIFAVIGIVVVGVFIAIKFHLTNTPGIIDTENRYLQATVKTAWKQTEEWKTLKIAIISDKDVINRAAHEAQIEPRLIVAQLVVEQMRLFNSERETFKQIFQPLRILGVQSQFSWGVMGLKQDTAIAIEQHIKDNASSYYLGPLYEHVLDATSTDPNTERFNRLTDAHNHFYSYLYAGIFLKQIMVQWKNAGFDISNRPEILSTLFNIGFQHSTPNADPKVGGAEINIGGEKYIFGELAYVFYNSDELTAEFPRNK